MHPLLVSRSDLPTLPASPVTIRAVSPQSWPDVAASLAPLARAFAAAQGFLESGKGPDAGKAVLLPNADGALAEVLFGVGDGADRFIYGKLPDLLPEGIYTLDGVPEDGREAAALAWLLGAYRFARYRDNPAPAARLVVPEGVDALEVSRVAESVALGRDLINTPANDLGPQELSNAAHALATRFGARFSVTVGDELLDANFPLVHAVGRASAQAPRLIDFSAGDESWPKVTIVGKGVTFDTGGLDIKPSSAMLLMKKDMGGAASALATAHMLLDAGVKVRLRVLIPAVENAISGASFRPGDVIPSRKGLSVEIGNTDAEGRLVLADALALAREDDPELIIDYATLTGAARVALGPELPPFYTEDDDIAAAIAEAGLAVNDPVWRLPLWAPYNKLLASKVADVNHISSGGFAGSITAALFLRRFTVGVPHVHFDIYGWTPSARPGRPEGGEVQAARLVYAWLKSRYGVAA
ncbi:leucyl aminopeptidase family protein [Pseudochelatococcus contaminans]|uniref:Leucyl aminopeptidase n=1 Tax=Pseudochelatococcus contaminans TaxID=1538103 RepID=A0A7W5Z176_9HYPH|nr:leucyl aminopeptidase family protein [Pseudochelatococcus contaminans]MBB3808035.1 leucyl aminopeptidase [Pseudochelatococcus contaminans]